MEQSACLEGQRWQGTDYSRSRFDLQESVGRASGPLFISLKIFAVSIAQVSQQAQKNLSDRVSSHLIVVLVEHKQVPYCICDGP